MQGGLKMNERVVIVCFGYEWDSWERRSNRILSGLSQDPNVGYVIFFESPLTFRQIFSYLNKKASFTIRERCKRLFSRGQISKVAINIYVITPIVPAVYLKIRWIQIVNEKLRYYQQWILYWMISRKIGLRKHKVILWFNRPDFNSGFLKLIRHDRALYDCTEDYTELLKTEPPYLSSKFAMEDELLTKKSSLITVVTNELYKRKININKHTYHISNGVDYEAFSEKVNKGLSEFFGEYIKPIIGYVGIINDRHDVGMLFEMASSHKDWSILLIGHQKESVYLKAKEGGVSNIHFLTGISANELPLTINAFNVCLSLFKKDYLNSTSSSMKIYQYLASGKPIVAYPISDAEYFADVIYLANDAQDFVIMVEKALRESPDDLKVNKRKEYARQHDWEHKVDMFRNIIF
jgi:glycosyltransferase involved in cell wall biosynthesis